MSTVIQFPRKRPVPPLPQRRDPRPGARGPAFFIFRPHGANLSPDKFPALSA